MRLTLRTLLAYLDDTLEPAEIKQIGQKVAESDAAQELIARIKQITRRRRLTTPPATGPGAANFDPNTVAEYLDNSLTSEQLAEVEKLCLESDVHLAEIATCHQILTLVLGEPALVPPTARERMYGLVQGKESIPFRKAPVTTPPVSGYANGLGDDGDEPLAGFGLFRTGWPRWLVPIVGVLLVAGLIFALVRVMPGAPHGRQVASRSVKAEGDTHEGVPPTANEKENEEPAREKAPASEVASTSDKPAEHASPEKKAATESPPKEPATTNAAAPKTPQDAVKAQPQPPSQPAQATPASAKTSPPRTERREIATYTVAPRTGPTLLVQRQDEQTPWHRLIPGGRVYSTDPLVSLPGYLSEVRLDSGVRLQLRGLIPEFATDSMMTLLLESAVVLHPSSEVDLDVTLSRGRIYVANEKESGPARVRIRVEREIWDLTLATPESEAIVEVIKRYSGDIRWHEGEEPWTGLYLGIIKGKGALNADYRAFSNLEMPGPAFFLWDNKGPGLAGPKKLEKPFQQWEKLPPANREADDMTVALEELSKRMTDKKSPEVTLMEGLQTDKLSQRLLSIYSFGALDEIQRLLDVLNDEDPQHGAERIKTVQVLRRWVSRGPEMAKLLYDPQKRSGILTKDMKATPGEAETIVKLLFGFNDAERRSADTYKVLADYLVNSRISIRELAIGDLYQMGAQVRYNPAWSEPERLKARADVYKLVEEQKLPPPLRAPGAPPAAGGGGR